MSGNHIPSFAADLSPRTWRQWWRCLPGYWRIGCWSVLGLLLIHVALLTRIYIGLQEPSEIRYFRKRNTVVYFWEEWRLDEFENSDPFSGYGWIASGIFGRSGGNITYVSLDANDTDETLAFLGDTCPNLRTLDARHCRISAQGLKALTNCHRLERIDLTDAYLFDDAMEYFLAFPELQQLDLTGTPISDAAIPVLKRIPRLDFLGLDFTDVSLAAVKDWEIVHSAPERDNRLNLRASVVWPDGSSWTEFDGNSKLTFGRVGSSDADLLRTTTILGANRRVLGELMRSWVTELWTGLAEDYEFVLTLGEYQSAPCIVSFKDGYPSKQVIEFRMPVSEAEASKPLAFFSVHWADGELNWTTYDHWWHRSVRITSLAVPSDQFSQVLLFYPPDGFRIYTGAFTDRPDGDYQIKLLVNEMSSAPERVTVRGGRLSAEHIDFNMSVTKEEALRFVPQGLAPTNSWSQR